MRRAAMAMAGVMLAGGLAYAQEHGGKVDWVRDPAFGMAKAKLEGRAMILYFTATW
jgi:hypothetical protein